MTPKQNFKSFLSGSKYEYPPLFTDIKNFYPEEIKENVARGFVFQQESFDRAKFGGTGFFGIEWIFESMVGGSMEVAPLFDDITEWRTHVIFPNLDDIDWEGIKARNEHYLNTDKLLRTSIFTGFFERLISFVGFENAAMALVDEDCHDDIHEIFSNLADLYIDFIHRMHKYCNVEIFELHDDWGSQNSTFFSKTTLESLILPYIKRVVSAAHEDGCFIEMHSCGHISSFVPCMIEAGIDTWRGQASALDKPAIIAEFGDRFNLSYEFKPDETLPLTDIMNEVREIKQRFKSKKVWYCVSIFTEKHIAEAIYNELKGQI